MKSNSFSRLSGWCAILAGAAGVLYSLAFVVLKSDLLSALFLLLGGLFYIAALTGLYERLREVEASYALLALVLGVGAAAGSLIHGGYDLANALHPPASLNMDLPSPVDPRGLLTFGVAGFGVYYFSRLMAWDKAFPKGLSTLGYVSSMLLIILYVARLFLTGAIILIPAALEGFIVNPIWYVWLGTVLLRNQR